MSFYNLLQLTFIILQCLLSSLISAAGSSRSGWRGTGSSTQEIHSVILFLWNITFMLYQRILYWLNTTTGLNLLRNNPLFVHPFRLVGLLHHDGCRGWNASLTRGEHCFALHLGILLSNNVIIIIIRRRWRRENNDYFIGTISTYERQKKGQQWKIKGAPLHIRTKSAMNEQITSVNNRCNEVNVRDVPKWNKAIIGVEFDKNQ